MYNAAENVIPFLMNTKENFTVLVVEDDRMQRIFIEQQIKDLGHDTMTAEDGQNAIDILVANKGDIDIVVMDRMMPVMDGLSAIRRMKEDPLFRTIPVIMVTGAGSQKDMQDGLEAGVFYYLNKPVAETVLSSVMTAAIREVSQLRSLRDESAKRFQGLSLLENGKFSFRTLQEAESLSAFLSLCYPEPKRVLQGIGELLINAVEHGNLEIGYERKTDLLDSGTWIAEIERRLEIDSYKNRKAEVVIARKTDGIYLVLTDQGKGFDWRRYMTIDPSRAADSHGRGIAQARATSFDRLTFNEQGNQAVAFVGYEVTLEW